MKGMPIGVREMQELKKPVALTGEKRREQIEVISAEITAIEERVKSRSSEALGKQAVEDLQKNIADHKERIEKQKTLILFKIEDLEAEVQTRTHIKDGKLNSFSIDDIEENTTPIATRAETEKKLCALREAYKMSIYDDQRLMEAIDEYLRAIKPEIEKSDCEQWEIISKLRKPAEEHKKATRELMGSYNSINGYMGDLFKAADISYPRAGYDKLVQPNGTWMGVAENASRLIEYVNGEHFEWKRHY